ncbi:MAG: MFS transporter [Burkholderiales bacterium]|nr:MFS transporter [Burkholderiales bacterium]
MPHASAHVPPSPPARTIHILEILALVLLWNSAYKGSRMLSTLYALELGAEPFDTGLLLATYGIFPLLLAVYAGKVADRYGVRMPLVVGMVISAVGVFMPFATTGFVMLVVAAAVTGMGFILVQISMQSLVGSLGSGAARTRNFNLYALSVSCADFGGPVLSGFAIDFAGHARTFLLLSLINVVALAGLIYLIRRIPRVPPGAAADRGGQRMADLFRVRDLRRIFVASAVVITGLDLFLLYMPLYGHSIGLSASAIGMVLGAFAAAGFVTRALIPILVRRFGEEKTLLNAMFLAAATLVLIPFFESAVVLGVICFVLGLGLGLGQPLALMLTYNYSPAGRAGESLGLRVTINNSIHVAAPVAFGAVGSLLGLAPVFWVSAASIALGMWFSRKRRAAPP